MSDEEHLRGLFQLGSRSSAASGGIHLSAAVSQKCILLAVVKETGMLIGEVKAFKQVIYSIQFSFIYIAAVAIQIVCWRIRESQDLTLKQGNTPF